MDLLSQSLDQRSKVPINCNRFHIVKLIWVVPKIRGPSLGVLINTDHNILGSILGSPIFGNTHITSYQRDLQVHSCMEQGEGALVRLLT